MFQRAVVSVGLAAILCCVAEAKPKTKLQRKWAAIIDPAAPTDPPRPWPELPSWLAVVFLIDRSVEPATLDVLKAAALKAHRALDDSDMAAILAFDTSTEKVLRAQGPVKERKKFHRALATVTKRGTSDLASALDEARAYLEPAVYRKVIVVFTNQQTVDDRLHAAAAAVSRDSIELLVVIAPGSDPPAWARNEWYHQNATVRVFYLEHATTTKALAEKLDELHYCW